MDKLTRKGKYANASRENLWLVSLFFAYNRVIPPVIFTDGQRPYRPFKHLGSSCAQTQKPVTRLQATCSQAKCYSSGTILCTKDANRPISTRTSCYIQWNKMILTRMRRSESLVFRQGKHRLLPHLWLLCIHISGGSHH